MGVIPLLLAALMGASAPAKAPKPKPPPPPAAPAPEKPAPLEMPPPPPGTKPAQKSPENPAAKKPVPENEPLLAPRLLPLRLDAGASIGPGFASGQTATSSSAPPYLEIVPTVTLEFAQLGPVRLAGALPVGLLFNHLEGFAPTSVTGFEFAPSIRAAFAPIPKIDLFADLGIGFAAYGSETQVIYLGLVRSNGTGPLFRLALGARYAATDRLTLFAEPVVLSSETITTTSSFAGNTSSSTTASSVFALRLGAQWRIDLPGVQR